MRYKASDCEQLANDVVHDGLFVRSSNTDGILNYLKLNGFIN